MTSQKWKWQRGWPQSRPAALQLTVHMPRCEGLKRFLTWKKPDEGDANVAVQTRTEQCMKSHLLAHYKTPSGPSRASVNIDFQSWVARPAKSLASAVAQSWQTVLSHQFCPLSQHWGLWSPSLQGLRYVSVGCFLALQGRRKLLRAAFIEKQLA